MTIQGQPLSASDLLIAIDGVVAADAVVAQLNATSEYALSFSRVFDGGELLSLQVVAQSLVGPLYGLVPATTSSLQLYDCVAPEMSAATVGSDELPFESAPTGADGYKVTQIVRFT